MKKISALLIAAASAFSLCTAPQPVAAADDYSVEFYLSAGEKNSVTQLSDNTVRIDSDALADGLTLDMNVFIHDDNMQVYSTYVYWRCDSEFITLGNLVNPKTDSVSDSPVTYTTSEGTSFTTSKMPFCYAEINEDLDLTVSKSLYTAVPPQTSDNTLGLSYVNSDTRPSPFETLGASSDEFPYASFTADIAAGTPEGVYEIYFLSKENPDYNNSLLFTKAAYCSEDGSSFASAKTVLDSFTIVVGSPYTLGDLNNDTYITATDAATTLSAYALESTSDSSSLTAAQKLAADVNADSNITATDAALILSYYAYSSTAESPVSFPDYLSSKLG